LPTEVVNQTGKTGTHLKGNRHKTHPAPQGVLVAFYIKNGKKLGANLAILYFPKQYFARRMKG